MEDTTIIAKGGQPAWKETFEHPEYGSLTFVVERMPTVQDWLNQTVMQEQLAPGLAASGAAAALVEGAAAMYTFMKRPVVAEDRQEDPDDPAHERVTKTFYEPLEDTNPAFVVTVWLTFWAWRTELLSDSAKEKVKNSSGATTGDVDDDSSPATTASPQTTLA